MNLVVIKGNIGADPELRYTQSGLAVCNVRIATNEIITQGDDRKNHTEWHSVVIFGKRAEATAKHKSKGDALTIRGHLRTSDYTDNNGVRRFSTRIHAEDVEF